MTDKSDWLQVPTVDPPAPLSPSPPSIGRRGRLCFAGRTTRAVWGRIKEEIYPCPEINGVATPSEGRPMDPNVRI